MDDRVGPFLLLEAMTLYCKAAAEWAAIDSGRNATRCVSQSALLSLQIRVPDVAWLRLPETAARGLMVQQQRFEEALIVGQAYGLTAPEDWTPVLWAHLMQPRHLGEFLSDMVKMVPLSAKELMELAQLFRAEVAGRGEGARQLASGFRMLLGEVRNLEVRLQMAVIASDFGDLSEDCLQRLDKVPEGAGPLILKRGHGGAYMPLM